MTKTKWRKEIKIYPGWDKRDPDPKKNYGIHGCEVRFILYGEKGVITFVCSTDWTPKNVQEERMRDHYRTDVIGVQPLGMDISYHSPIPLTDVDKDPEWHNTRPKCEYLKGKPCYNDGSSLHAEVVRDAMLKEGEKGVWREMRKYYRQTFDPNRRATVNNANFGELMHAFAGALKDDDDDSKGK